MKILMIMSVPFPPKEGIGYFVNNLTLKLTQRGHEVNIITRGSLEWEFIELDHSDLIRTPYLPLYPIHIKIQEKMLNKFINKHCKEFDIIHIHTPLTPIPRTEIPIISTIHSSMVGNAQNLDVINMRTIGIKAMTRFVTVPNITKLMKKSTITTVVSDSVRDEIEEFYGVNNLIVCGNGVDENKFYPPNEIQNNRIVLYAGRLSYGKGIIDMFNAVKEFLKNDDIKIILCGDGELKRILMKKIISNKLEDKIILMGQIEHEKIPELYRNASVFLFPSYYEGLPTVLLEAMASGLPVIVNDIPAYRNIIHNNVNGILIEKGNPKDLAEKLRALLDDSYLRKKLSMNARDTILSRYTWNEISNIFEQIYNDVKY